MNASGTRISQVIGQNARRIRTEIADATQQQVAVELVKLGLPWSAGRVAQLELGRVSPTLPTVVLVAAALDALTPKSRPVTVVDLLAADGGVELTSGVVVPSATLGGVLRGGKAGALAEYRRPFGMSGESAAELSAKETYGRTDERAAKELGLDKYMMIKLSTTVWGHNLSEERDRRVEALDGPVSRVAKARITQQLRAELADELERWSAERQ